MSFFFQIIKGIFIGAGAILPGISSGVLCVVFGIYEKLLNAALGFFSNVKENFKFLFPILIGILGGVVLFGNLLNYLFSYYKVPAYFCFVGLILGSVPSILKEAQLKSVKFHHVLSLLLTFSFSLYLVAVEHFLTSYSFVTTSFASFVLTGFAMSAGVVIPGVSSTVILMLLGKYELYLSAISTLNFSILVPMGIGLLIGSILLLLLIRFFLTYFKTTTYFAILGFVLGSVPVLLPSISSVSDGFVGIVAFILGLLVSLAFSNAKKVFC